jgi:hypothetical protein
MLHISQSPHHLGVIIMRIKRAIAVSVTSVLIVSGITATTAYANDTIDTVTSSETAAALAAVDKRNDPLIAEPVASKADADLAAVVTTADGTALDVPKDPADGVSLDAKNASPVTINLFRTVTTPVTARS